MYIYPVTFILTIIKAVFLEKMVLGVVYKTIVFACIRELFITQRKNYVRKYRII